MTQWNASRKKNHARSITISSYDLDGSRIVVMDFSGDRYVTRA